MEFSPKLLRVYKFLRYNEEFKIMWRHYCSCYDLATKWNINRKYRNKNLNKFTNGVKRFKSDGITIHSLSDNHREAIDRHISSKTLIKKVSNMFDKALNDFKRIINIVLFITKQRIAMSKFPTFCEFLKEMNVILTNNNLYQTRYGYVEILKTISEVILKEQIKRIKNSKQYSIIIDESTDMSSQKELLIYIKYYDDIESQIKTEFLKLIKLAEFIG